MIALATKPDGAGMLAWLGANKDALLAFAAIVITPVLALFGMVLSQRNMARSLMIQREAMQKNLDVSVHQLVNAERQLRQQARVATAGIVGAIEREQLERFSSRCARLLELHEEVSNKESLLETYAEPREFVRLNREMGSIANELKLLVPDGLTSSFFAMAASGLVVAASVKDLGRRLEAREEFIRRAREVTALWHARIGRLVEAGDDGAPAR
jgi:hypothetical protein